MAYRFNLPLFSLGSVLFPSIAQILYLDDVADLAMAQTYLQPGTREYIGVRAYPNMVEGPEPSCGVVLSPGVDVGTRVLVVAVEEENDYVYAKSLSLEERFRIIQRWRAPEGYLMAEVELIEEDEVPTSAEEAASESAQVLDAQKTLSAIVNSRLFPHRIATLTSRYGPMPSGPDVRAAALAYWAGVFLPLSQPARQSLLETVRGRDRLRLVLQLLSASLIGGTDKGTTLVELCVCVVAEHVERFHESLEVLPEELLDEVVDRLSATKKLTITTLSMFKNCHQLSRLSLQKASNDFVPLLKSFPALTSLSLPEAYTFTNTRELFLACPSLRELSLHNCKQVKVLEGIESLVSLQSLDLGGTTVWTTELNHLAPLTALTRLDISGTGLLAHTSSATLLLLECLTSLDVSNTRLSDKGLIALAGLPNLTDVSIGMLHDCSSEGLAAFVCGLPLHGLQRLNACLNANADDEFALAVTQYQAALTHFDVHRTGLGGPGVRSLGALAALTVLDLTSTDVHDEDLVCLGALACLTAFYCNYTYITDEGCVSIAAVSSLRVVSVMGNEGISDAGCRTLARLTGVRYFVIGSLKITDVGLEAIAVCPALERLSVYQSSCTDRGVAFVRNSTSLLLDDRMSLTLGTYMFASKAVMAALVAGITPSFT